MLSFPQKGWHLIVHNSNVKYYNIITLSSLTVSSHAHTFKQFYSEIRGDGVRQKKNMNIT